MINKKILELIKKEHDNSTIFVINGFDPIEFGCKRANLDELLETPESKSTRKLLGLETNVITMEEFLHLYNGCMSLFEKVIILKNPIYCNLRPLYAEINPEHKTGLLRHFTQEDNIPENLEIGPVERYTGIYCNMVETAHGTMCCYNVNEERLLKTGKVIFLDLTEEKELETTEAPTEFFSIYNELDYIRLVDAVMKTDKKYRVSFDNYEYGRAVIAKPLNHLNSCYEGRIFKCDYVCGKQAHPMLPDVKSILKRYWGYDQFRNFKVYNYNSLIRGKKVVQEVSQNDVVMDAIEQAENAQSNKRYRDIFVTAPTGAGKSLMFQLPAIYLAEKHNLVTLVISPLIGLMQDQVYSLQTIGYAGAATINSDISPVSKQEILDRVKDGTCSILYLSPESLLGKSGLEQLIGNRQIGMVVVDEAHIVTTWGKQFRPDYWYLGDHIAKLRKEQVTKTGAGFVIASFTATAIYGGREDMFHETLNSLKLGDAITYLGYLKRNNITIDIKNVTPEKGEKKEYERDKFYQLVGVLEDNLRNSRKTLVYFPTIRLIVSFYGFLRSLRPDIYEFTACYNGGMNANAKAESFENFKKGENTLVMLATKAFGMGIDIPDIDCVLHYAPTGNVCDYMQEIGRAARDEAIQGTAVYKYMKDDFRYINQLHGMSTIRGYQLTQVMRKILELHEKNLKKYGSRLFKKRNEMLVDAESFKHIFSSSDTENDAELINKVKTAMLIIQKDYEPRGYAPFYIKPVPLFSKGYFQVSELEKAKLEAKYPGVLKQMYAPLGIYEVDLNRIWEYSYKNKMSFPKFKYELYNHDAKSEFNKRHQLNPALAIDLELKNMDDSHYYGMINPIVNMIKDAMVKNEFISLSDMISKLNKTTNVSEITAKSILSVLLDAMNQYSRKYASSVGNPVYNVRLLRNDKLPEEARVKYRFNTLVYRFFEWLMLGYEKVAKDGANGKLYVINDTDSKESGAILTVLGVLEAFDMLTFSSLGGSNSQIYIYVNETKELEEVKANPNFYRNKLLELVGERHRTSVAVLKHIFENRYTSDEVWELLENYFLGIVPEEPKFDISRKV